MIHPVVKMRTMTSFLVSVALTLHVNQFSGQTVDIVFFGTGTKNYSVGGLFVSLVFGLSIFGISGLDSTREPIFRSNGRYCIFGTGPGEGGTFRPS